MVRANRLFHESALPNQYATLAFGRTSNRGELELANAGHLPVLLAGKSGVTTFESNCKPLGFFSDEKVEVVRAVMSPGDTVVLYTDGVSEASNADGEEYGVEALRKLIAEQHPSCCPAALVKVLQTASGGVPRSRRSAPTMRRCWRFSMRRRWRAICRGRKRGS